MSCELSIIIVTYNSRNEILDCLESIRSVRDSLEIQTLIVDNASTDGTAALDYSAFPDTTLLANRVNRGFPAANNQALPLCRGELIMLLNPDTVVQPGSLQLLIDYLRQHPHCAVCGPLLVDAAGSPEKPLKVPSPWTSLARLSRFDAFGRILYRSPGREYISGACMLFRRTLLDMIGTLDERLFWSEDADFCLRARKAGFVISLVSGARVVHLQARSGNSNVSLMLERQYVSMLGFIIKHGKYWEARLATAIFRIEISIRLVKWLLVSFFQSSNQSRLRVRTLWRLEKDIGRRLEEQRELMLGGLRPDGCQEG